MMKLPNLKWYVLLLAISLGNYVNAQYWTWKNGNDIIDQVSVSGTLSVAGASNTPGAREGACSWTDASGNLWLFGGNGYTSSYGRCNDLWKYASGSNMWTWVNGSQSANQPGVYGTQGTGASTNTPGGRAYAVTWTDASGNLWLFGGEGYDASGSFGYLNDLWKYDIASNSWTWMKGSSSVNQTASYGAIGTPSASNVPGARRLMSGWFESTGPSLYLFGGDGYASSGTNGMLNDVWKYNVSSGNWTWVGGANAILSTPVTGTLGLGSVLNIPGPRYGHTMWRQSSNTVWLFGGYGYDGSSQGVMSDIWKYNSSTGVWTWMDGPSTVGEAEVNVIKGVPSPSNTPGGRCYMASWKDASSNLYILGGYNGGQNSDLWQYNITTGNWTWIRGGTNYATYGTRNTASVTNEPGGGYLRTSWTDLSNNFWLFGGIGYDKNVNNSRLNDLWTTTLPTTAPTASFVINQTAQVCIGTKLKVTDLSTNQPVAWTYSLDGVTWNGSQNFYLQNPPNTMLTAGVHTVSLLSANAAGYSPVYSQTINVINSTVATLTTAPSGSTNVYVGSGQTNSSDWSPWVYTFTDPLPAGAQITRIVMTYDGIDQQFGGTGVGATMYIDDNYIGGPALYHTWQSLSIDYNGLIPNYNNGGSNTLKMYFWGYPGWQAFIQNANLQFYYQTGTVTVCAGQTVTLTATGAQTYTWTNGAVNGASHTPSASAVYTVTATDAAGCVNTATEAVVVNALPVITLTPASICSGSSYTLNPSGASTYTYLNGGPVVTPAASTSYSVTGTSTAGCVSAAAGVGLITVNSNPVVTAPSGAICVGNSYTLSPSGAGSYTYSGGSAVVTPTVTSTYTINGINAAGCSAISPAVVTVTVNPLPLLSVTGSNTVCSGSAVSQTVAGASTYTWSNSFVGNIAFLSPAANTVYTITGKDANNCVSTQTTAVNVIALPVVTVPNGTICAGNSYTLSPSGAATYTYSGGAAVVSPVTTTSYSVTGTSTTGCVSAPAVANVLVNSLPVVTITGTNQVCSGGSVTETASGASSYSWSTGSTGSVITISPAATGSYVVTGTSSLGCSASATRVVTVNPLPIISVNSGSICSGNAFTIVPSGAVTYTFSGGSNVVSPPTTSAYSVTGADALGCVSAAAAISSVTVFITPTISVSGGTICSGSPFVLAPSGAATYTFSSGGSTVTPLTTTSYSITGTSTQGCPAVNPAVATVTAMPLPVLSIAGSNTVCTGLPVTKSVTGASTYTWSNGTIGASTSISPTLTASYSVTGTSTSGCINVASTTITVMPNPIISVANATICSGTVYTLTPTGAATYTYSSGSAIVSPTVTSSYSVTGSSSFGCVSPTAAVAAIQVNAQPTVSVNSGAICAGSTFTLVPSGASTYTFSSGSSIVAPGSTTAYSVTGTSSLGCVSMNTAVSNITVNPLPVLTISGPNAVCNGATITETVSGATSYSWNTGATTNTISINISSPATYVVYGTNAVTGCSTSASKLITVGSLPVISVNSGNICPGTSFTMIPGGASTYTFSNGTGTVSNIVSPTVSTSYFVSGTSSLGCVSTAPAISNVVLNASPVISVNSGGICQGGSWQIVPSGASTYTITGGSFTVSPSVTTSYSVTGTSIAGCVAANAAVATVTVNSIPVISASGGSVCAGGAFTLAPSGATSYTYSGGAQVVSPAVTTAYSITGSSQGCAASNTAVVTVTVVSNPTVTVPSGTLCSGNAFTLSPSGATSYTYSSGSATVTPATNSTYSVIGANAAGCVSSNTAVATVSVLASPVILVNSGTICSGDVFTISPSGAASYSVTGGSFTVSPAASTSYTVNGIAANGCSALIPAVTMVSVGTTPTLSISGPTAVCLGSSAQLTASGASSYLWSNNASTSTLQVSPQALASYTVYGNNGSCASFAVASLSVLPLPVVTVSSAVICPNQSFTLSPAGALSYTVSGGAFTVNPAVTTVYTITGSDFNQCVSPPVLATLSVVNTVTLSVSSDTAICVGDSVTLSVSGATSYLWSTGDTTSTIVKVPPVAGAYTVSGTTGACTNTAAIQIILNALPQVGVASNPVTCIVEPFVIVPTGAIAYTLNNVNSGNSFTVMPAATTGYTLIGKDGNGCVATAVIEHTVDACTGLSAASQVWTLRLFPNPNAGRFTVETPDGATVKVLSLLGDELLTTEVPAGPGVIDIRHLARGMYVVRVTVRGRSQTARMVFE